MSLPLTRVALERNRVTLVVILALLVMGLTAYGQMPREESPKITVRTAVVTTIFPGATPERVEQLVTDPVEQAIQEIPQLDHVSSTSRSGVSIVKVSIRESEKVMRPIWDDLRRKVDAVAPTLPADARAPEVNDSFGEDFGTLLAITAEGYDDADLLDVAEELRDRLLQLGEVDKSDLHGEQEQLVQVEFDNARLSEVGLSPGALRQQLQTRNTITPGGAIAVGPESLTLEPSGSFESVTDLAGTLIRLPGSEQVQLRDLASVRRASVDPADPRVRYSGLPAIAVSVSLRTGGNIARMGEDVRATVAALQAELPIGVDVREVAFAPDEVQRSVDDFMGSLAQSVAVVLLVMLVFLGLRTGLVVATLIPSTIVVTFAVMDAMSISLNQVSLAALLIALGMLVDNAIVVAEAILVELRAGRSPREATLAATSELWPPLLTSSLTTAAAFLPIYLADSQVGEFTAAIFLVVTIALLSSWALALTLSALMGERFLRVGAEDEGGRLYDVYRRLLIGILRHRWLFVGGVTGALVLSLGLLKFVPFLFFPPSERATFVADFDLPPAASLEETSRIVGEIESFLRDELSVPQGEDAPGVTSWISFLGEGGPAFVAGYTSESPRDNYASLVLNTSSRAQVEPTAAALRRFCESRFPDLAANVRLLESGVPVGRPISIRVTSSDTDELFARVGEIERQLRGIPGTTAVANDWGLWTKSLYVDVSEARALRAGVSNEDVAVSLRTALSGLNAGELRDADGLLPIELRADAERRNDLSRLDGLAVYSSGTGASVPLSQIADVSPRWAPSRILRRSRQRTISVEAGVVPGATPAEVLAQVSPWLEAESEGWGRTTTYSVGGESEASAEANRSILVNLPLVALIMFGLLVVQFNSFRRTAIVLATIPFGLTGVILGLLVLRSYFGFMTLLGVISLAGIVINNGTVLLDRIRVEIDEVGRTPTDAVVEAAVRRLRPILLTTATTVLGLVPLWLGGGPMWEPLAITIMGGLLYATVITLGLVPVLYSILFRVEPP